MKKKTAKKKPSRARLLNQTQLRQEMRRLLKPSRPLAAPAPVAADAALLVVVDRHVALPYLVRWREPKTNKLVEQTCATAAETRTYLELLVNRSPELWVRVRHKSQ